VYFVLLSFVRLTLSGVSKAIAISCSQKRSANEREEEKIYQILILVRQLALFEYIYHV
jgi:hypothetical protein